MRRGGARHARTIVLALLAVTSATLFAPALGTASATTPSLQPIIEPNSGITPIYRALKSARHSIDLAMYELVDPQVDAILARDAAAGVRVRVMLDKNGEQSANTPAFMFLASHRVQVRWAPAKFDRTHEKVAIIDGHIAMVMTLNLTERYYASTRDFVIEDSDPGDVAAIGSVFASDWNNGSTAEPRGADLLWSPGSERALVNLIGTARQRLLVENEEMGDAYITNALEAAARRGVNVELVMTRDRSWSTAFDQLTLAGVHVRTYAASAPLYIHAKAIDVDPNTVNAQVFVGSENFSIASLLYNRELGLITKARSVTTAITTTINDDFVGASPWSS